MGKLPAARCQIDVDLSNGEHRELYISIVSQPLTRNEGAPTEGSANWSECGRRVVPSRSACSSSRDGSGPRVSSSSSDSVSDPEEEEPSMASSARSSSSFEGALEEARRAARCAIRSRLSVSASSRCAICASIEPT